MNNDAALVAAQPMVVIGGDEQPELVAQLLMLDIRDDVEGMARCEAEFGNWGVVQGALGYRYFDRQLLDFGKAFIVKLGDATLFEGRIMALQAIYPEGAPPRIRVLADDKLQDLRMVRRSRSFADVSDADLVQRIASDHGLQSQADTSGPTHKHLAQLNQTDLALLHDRARASGAELWIEGDTLHLQPRSGRAGEAPTLKMGKQLREFEASADLSHQRTSVLAQGWDVAAKQAISESAGSDLLSSELGNDESGVSILQQALGERIETLAHGMPSVSEEAKALAESHFRAAARRFVTGRGVAETSSGLRCGGAVQLQGLGPLFDGKYVVHALRHRFDTRLGLRTEFHVERPGIGRN